MIGVSSLFLQSTLIGKRKNFYLPLCAVNWTQKLVWNIASGEEQMFYIITGDINCQKQFIYFTNVKSEFCLILHDWLILTPF